MICSGKQTVIFKLVTPDDSTTVDLIVSALKAGTTANLIVTSTDIGLNPENPPATASGTDKFHPSATACDTDKSGASATAVEDFIATETSFTYTERLGFKNDLYIVGGGHCALALSELMSKMDFHISLFDDRPELNTIEKNRFAHEVTIIDKYGNIGSHVRSGERTYVVVMTLGYKSDEQVIRALIDTEFKYFGVLGSNAKMSAMFKELIKEGMPAEKLDRIRTPVGIAINSRTPEEIAVSIAAEIISVKNSA